MHQSSVFKNFKSLSLGNIFTYFSLILFLPMNVINFIWESYNQTNINPSFLEKSRTIPPMLAEELAPQISFVHHSFPIIQFY